MTSILQKTHEAMCRPVFTSEREKNKCYPSSASAVKQDRIMGPQVIGACLRAEFYRMTGDWIPLEESYVSIRRMGYGNPLAAWEIEQMTKAGFIPVAQELQVQIPHLRVSGRIDIIVWDPYASDFVGIEQKTTAGRSARGVVSPDAGKMAPKPEHVLQTAVYAYCMRNYTPQVRKWKIIYYDRETCEDAEYDLYLTDEDRISVAGQDYGIGWTDIEARYKSLVDYVDAGEEPPRDYELLYSKEKLEWMASSGMLSRTDREKLAKGKLEKGDWRCKYCPYAAHCYREGAPKP